jgi:hypothetical protein
VRRHPEVPRRRSGGGDFPAQSDGAAFDLLDVHIDAASAREPVIARFAAEDSESHHSQPAALARGARCTQLCVSKGLYGRRFTRLESES